MGHPPSYPQSRYTARPMHRKLIAFSLIVLATLSMAQTSGSAQTAVLASINQFVDGLNKGDTKTAVAACADETSIIDEFPPHEWHGAGACAKWLSDFDADTQEERHYRWSGDGGQGVARGCQLRLCLCRPSCELHVQAEGEVSQRSRLDHYVVPAQELDGLANHGMGLGEALGCASFGLHRVARQRLAELCSVWTGSFDFAQDRLRPVPTWLVVAAVVLSAYLHRPVPLLRVGHVAGYTSAVLLEARHEGFSVLSNRSCSSAAFCCRTYTWFSPVRSHMGS